MLRIGVFKLTQRIGTVLWNPPDLLTVEGDEDFQAFIQELNNGYASNREFVEDIPERLSSYIYAIAEEGAV